MEDTRSRWHRAYKEACECDEWGQVEEALEGYQRLQEHIENVLQLSPHRLEQIRKLSMYLKQRIQELQSTGKHEEVGLQGMKALQPFMKRFLVSDVEFPAAATVASIVLPSPALEQQTARSTKEYNSQVIHVHEDAEPTAPNADTGKLRPKPRNLQPGDQVVSIYIDRWGFKDASGFVDPYLVVSVRDGDGETLEAAQESPIAKKRDQQYVFFENNVHVQTPLGKLPLHAVIFIELWHYKPKKKKQSNKAYCFIEMEDVKEGLLALEVYRKPAAYLRRKRKPTLLSVKPLYLHVSVSISVVT